ncbi:MULTISPECIES: hypothetical protein [Pseudomonas]|jgi:hypothetical protein|uniref:hypothetical protein n=1 Tax=Pseudomonas TaxID=286 RepID=UPI001CBD7ADA|nr:MULTISPECIES: hypothetical protein [Pseudomonas]UST64443.1 hypothetical protein NF673_01470 [Pseudomonas moraviensis]GLH17321.1 hypothetical protein BR1R3_00620 [Pseudomonas atacamensis]
MKNERQITPIISDKPYPIPIEMRPLWRISLIIISIERVSNEKKYLDSKKLNILIWMLIRKNRWPEYEDYLKDRTLDIPLISVDTATYKAIEICVAKALVTLSDGRVHITDAGQDIYRTILESAVMQEEIDFLDNFGKKLTDAKVKSLTGGLI